MTSLAYAGNFRIGMALVCAVNTKNPILLLVTLLLSLHLSAQDVRPFTVRYTTDARGKMVMVTNNIITTKRRSGGTAVKYDAAPPACPAGSFLCKNDGEFNTNIDIDGDPTTFNSSSATLTMPTCNSVAYAALYWSAGIAISQNNNGALPMRSAGWNNILFKAPGGTYQAITADKTDTLRSVFHGYQCFRDVTDLVRAAGVGSYTIANVKCDTVNAAGQPLANAFGGWTMVVIYADPSQALKNFTIFDGLTVIGNTAGINSKDITITGFKCPPIGNVVASMGVVVYDGDRGAADGFFMKKNTTGVFTNQTFGVESAASTSNFNDAWNSSITDKGSLVTSRIPAHQNTYGFDAHIYKLANSGNTYLRNSDNSAVVRISTTSEGYVLGLLTSEIDTYYPELVMENTITPLSSNPDRYTGDTLRIYSVVKNIGNNTATGVRAEDRLQPYFKYVPNSITIENVTKTDIAADDEAEFIAATNTIIARLGTSGSIANSDPEYKLSYLVTITTNCADIPSTPMTLQQQTKLFYQDQVSSVFDSTASRPKSLDNCVAAISAGAVNLNYGCMTILPVKLLSFTGIRAPGGNQLLWKMQEEKDAAIYVVQVATDGIHFKDIYNRHASGSSGIFSYSYTDNRSYASGNIYYRIKTTFKTGRSEYSGTIRINTSTNNTITLQQQSPTARTVTIRSSEPISFVQFYNTKGQFLKSTQAIVANQPVDVTDLPPGIYYLRVYTKENMQVVKLLRQ